MEAFLNERSLEKYTSWRDAMRLFWAAANELRGHATLFRDSAFFRGPDFGQRFNAEMTGVSSELRPLFRQVVFSNRYWQCWRDGRASRDVDEYSCEELQELFLDESLGEAAERKIHDNGAKVHVLSGPGSSFAERAVLVLKKEATQELAHLRHADNIASVKVWLTEERGYYDLNSRVPPLDFQTILGKDTTRFRPTNRRRKGGGKDRRIYLEVDTGYQFYVDEGHNGHAAHLEVFDAQGQHLGEATISTGELNPEGREPGRTIDL